MPRGGGHGKPCRTDAQNRGSGHAEVIHQCRPHRQGEVGSSLVDADWHEFCQALYKGIEEEDWGELYDAYKEMSRAVGVKPQVVQRAKALWKIKAAKDAGEEYYDPDRKDNILRGNKTRLALWEEHLKDPIVALKCVENSC